MNIVFAIPTWNRAALLRECVETIAQQMPDGIFISDNCSTDDTPDVCRDLAERYHFVHYIRQEKHVPFADNFKAVVNFAEGDFTWMFGDDDLLMPEALVFVRRMLQSGLDFYHVAEESRALTDALRVSPLLTLCNEFGFLEMTGFISGNIARTDRLKRAFNSPHWDVYARSAYPQSLALLDEFWNSGAALVDLPIVRSPVVDRPDTGERWFKEDIIPRYIFIMDGLLILQKEGKVPPKLSEHFFRYLNGTIIGRMMDNYLGRTFNRGKPVEDREWRALEALIRFIDGERGEIMLAWLWHIEQICISSRPAVLAAQAAADYAKEEAEKLQLPLYPFTYLMKEEKAA